MIGVKLQQFLIHKPVTFGSNYGNYERIKTCGAD